MKAAMPCPPMIDVRNLRKAYRSRDGAILALDEVTFHIAPQEFVSIIGPSGCGKSTILKIIAGLVEPSGGTISIEGTPIGGPQRKIGMVFQIPALMKWRTVLQNVLLPTEILRLPPKDMRQRALDLLKLVGLDEFAHKYPHELSGGMQQRVGIARALIHDPTILLLDEPFSALDVMTRSQLNSELLRIWSERRKTSLLVTHSIPEAIFLSDRVVVMSPRPARIVDIVEIPLPRPRTPEMRVSASFIEVVGHIGRRIGLEYV